MKRPWLTVSVLVGLLLWHLSLAGFGGQPEGRVLIEHGARKMNGGFPQAPWRLLASLALHANWFHFLSNAFILAVWGSLVELLLGPMALFGLLLLAGIWGNLLSDIYGPELLAVGASGAGFGLLLCVLCLSLLCPEEEAWRGQARAWLKITVLGLVLNALPFLGLLAASRGYRFDHWAHGGGAAYGFLVGLVAAKAPKDRRRMALVLTYAVTGLLAALVIWQRGASPFG